MNELDLHDRLDALGTHLDDERQRRNAPTSDPKRRAPTRAGGRVLLVAAVAALLVGSVALVARDSGTAEQIQTADQTPTTTTTVLEDGRETVDRTIFPIGGRAGAERANFPSARDVAGAYLEDRIDVAPDGIDLSFGIRDTIDVPGTGTIVRFFLRTPDDQGDGHVLVTPEAGDGALAVVASSTVGLELLELEFDDGVVVGRISATAAGERRVEIVDADSGELISVTTRADESVAPLRFGVDGIDAEAVMVRVWIGVAGSDVSRANFAEVLLVEGYGPIDAGWSPLSQLAHGEAGSEPSDEDAPASTIRPDGCQINVRVYNASARAGIAGAVTTDVNALLEGQDIVTVLAPQNASADWDGAVAWLIGSDARCVDAANLGLPEPDVILNGDLLQQWADLGFEWDDDFAVIDSPNTIVVVLGRAFDG